VLKAAQESMGAIYDDASQRLLGDHPVMDRLAQATNVYAQTLAEWPADAPRTGAVRAPRPRVVTVIEPSIFRLVGSHEAAPSGAAPRTVPATTPALTPAQAPAADALRQVRRDWMARYEAAAADMLRADGERRALIDAFVATPAEAVQELVAMAEGRGALPLHPLVPPLEVDRAARLFAAVAERPAVLDALRQAAPLTAEARRQLGESLVQALTAPAAVPPKLAAMPLSPASREQARIVGERVVAARDSIVATVDAAARLRAGAATEGGRLAARHAGAQVLYAEVTGKDACSTWCAGSRASSGACGWTRRRTSPASSPSPPLTGPRSTAGARGSRAPGKRSPPRASTSRSSSTRARRRSSSWTATRSDAGS